MYDLDYEICGLFDEQMELQRQQANVNLVDIKESVFDDILPSFEKLREDMIETICKNCMWEIKSRSKNYKKEK